MNHTEEEARGLLCPMAFGKGLTSPVRCFGSKCMLWGWTIWIDNGNETTFAPNQQCEPIKGRCGGVNNAI